MTEQQARKAQELLNQIQTQRNIINTIETLLKGCSHDETVLQLSYGMTGDGFTIVGGWGRNQVKALLNKEIEKQAKLIKELELL